MARNREILLDPIFTDKFFEYKNEEGMSATVSFPLPASQEELPTFLETVESLKREQAKAEEDLAKVLQARANARTGDDRSIYDQEITGLQTFLTKIPDRLKRAPENEEKMKFYKEGFANIIHELMVWAKEHNIDGSPCERFKKNYLEYGGSNEERNKLDFHLYHEGILSLAGIVKQIKNNELPLDSRKDIIQNLLQGINVCGPGTFTNITNAYLELLSLSNISIYWMKLRRSIAEQVVLELIKKIRYPVPQGMEIHYVNGVLNRFSDALGIQMVEDGYVAQCNPYILNGLFYHFKQVIPNSLSLFRLLEFASNQDCENLRAKLESGDPQVYADTIKKIEKALKRFGPESPDKRFYLNERSIIQLYGEFEDKIAIDWKASSILFMSIYSRMQRAGLIDLHQEGSLITEDNLQVWNLPHREIRLAYVRKEEDEKISCVPFIGYCVETLAEKDSPHKTILLELLFSDKVSYQNRLQIALGIATYFKSTLVKQAAEENNQLYQPLMDLLPSLMRSPEHQNPPVILPILSELPEAQRLVLMRSLGAEAFRSVIKSCDQLVHVLKHVPADHRLAFLESLGADFIKPIPIIKNSSDLGRVLCQLPQAQWRTWMESLGGDFIQSRIQAGSDLGYLLGQLPEGQWKAFMKKSLFGPDFKDAIKDYGLGTIMSTFLEGDKKKRMALLENLGVDVIKDVVRTAEEFFSVLEELSDDQWGPFLNGLGADFIKRTIQSGYDLANMLVELDDEGPSRARFLESFGVDIIKDIIRTSDELSQVWILSGHDRLAFLESLGADFIKRTIQNGYQLADTLKRMDGDHKAFLDSQLGIDVIKSVVRTNNELRAVLENLPVGQWKPLLNSLGTDFIKRTIQSGEQLAGMLKELNNHLRIVLLESLGVEVLKVIIQSNDQLDSVLKKLPEEGDRKTLLKILGEDMVHLRRRSWALFFSGEAGGMKRLRENDDEVRQVERDPKKPRR